MTPPETPQASGAWYSGTALWEAFFLSDVAWRAAFGMWSALIGRCVLVRAR